MAGGAGGGSGSGGGTRPLWTTGGSPHASPTDRNLLTSPNLTSTSSIPNRTRAPHARGAQSQRHAGGRARSAAARRLAQRRLAGQFRPQRRRAPNSGRDAGTQQTQLAFPSSHPPGREVLPPAGMQERFLHSTPPPHPPARPVWAYWKPRFRPSPAAASPPTPTPPHPGQRASGAVAEPAADSSEQINAE